MSLVLEMVVVLRGVEEVPDEEHQQVTGRVCAIDVAKESGKVCTRVPHETRPGGRVCKVWDVDAATPSVIELADHLAGEGIEVVTVESTSDYWQIFFYLLEARGLKVQLVSARDMKNVPGGPKTDKLDAVWLASSPRRGCCGPRSFRPRRSGASGITSARART